MNKICVLATALSAVSLSTTALGNSFTAGDLVVYRLGDGSTSLSNNGAQIFLDEFTPTGTLVQSINVTSLAAGGQFIGSGIPVTEGMMTLSPNGQYLALGGYKAAMGGSSSLVTSTSTNVNRAFGIVDNSGGLLSQTNLTDFSSGNSPRSALTLDGTNLWVTGGATGISYANVGATTSTPLASSPTSIRQVQSFGGQLYISTNATGFRMATVGTGMPTTGGNTVTSLPGFSTTTGSPNAFYFADLSSSVAGVDTLYIADDTNALVGGLYKYSLVGGSWVSNGSIVQANLRGLTGSANGGSVSLFATSGGVGTASGGGALFAFSDTSGYNGALSGSLTQLASAGTNTVFRGVAFAPTNPVPEPATLAVLGIGVLAAFRRRKRSR